MMRPRNDLRETDFVGRMQLPRRILNRRIEKTRDIDKPCRAVSDEVEDLFCLVLVLIAVSVCSGAAKAIGCRGSKSVFFPEGTGFSWCSLVNVL